jgi:predicted glycosyltransferase
VRPLRIALLASNGLSTGHLTRSLAIATALVRVGAQRNISVEPLLATTSEADDLLRAVDIPSVRLPSPRVARRSGWSDEARRALAEGVLLGIATGMRPDVLVVDTFPSGPQLEATKLLDLVPRKVLIRRSIRENRALDPRSKSGLEKYELVVCPDDPFALDPDAVCAAHAARMVRVPPITLHEVDESRSRSEARARLGLPADARLALVAFGGGGDPGSSEVSALISRTLLEVDPTLVPVVALGPLATRPSLVDGVLTVKSTPLQLDLAAFDLAISAAGYNSAHELAKAKIPTAFLARERMFDDQAGRAERFARAGHAAVLVDTSREAIEQALAQIRKLSCPGLIPGGADAAAREILMMIEAA